MTSNSSDQSIKSVNRKLKTLYAHLEATMVFTSKYHHEINNINQVRVCLEELSSISGTFEELQTQIEVLVELDDNI